ncbi:hypothetical protein PG991_013428 [Apiospora marii]|uniref:Uncharacterized protein n=2 Tax=Apiospora marii TaxID=335849 RepID=A0ABR1R608_9PEZI
MSSLSRLEWLAIWKEDELPYHTAPPQQDQEKPTFTVISLQETLDKMPDRSSLSKLTRAMGFKGPSLPYYMPQKPMEPFSASPYDEPPEPIFTSTHEKEKWDKENQRRLFEVQQMRNRLEDYWWRFFNTITFCFRRVAVGSGGSSMARLTKDPSHRAMLVTFAISFFMCELIWIIFRTGILEWLRQ